MEISEKNLGNFARLKSEKDIFLLAVLDFQPEVEFTVYCSL